MDLESCEMWMYNSLCTLLNPLFVVVQAIKTITKKGRGRKSDIYLF